MKEKISKANYIKIENICLLKDSIYLFFKGNHLGKHMCKTYKIQRYDKLVGNTHKMQKKILDKLFKQLTYVGRYPNDQFMHRKMLNSLLIGKMNIKMTTRYHFKHPTG